VTVHVDFCKKDLRTGKACPMVLLVGREPTQTGAETMTATTTTPAASKDAIRAAKAVLAAAEARLKACDGAPVTTWQAHWTECDAAAKAFWEAKDALKALRKRS